jgi:hypothetical protein
MTIRRLSATRIVAAILITAVGCTPSPDRPLRSVGSDLIVYARWSDRVLPIACVSDGALYAGVHCQQAPQGASAEVLGSGDPLTLGREVEGDPEAWRSGCKNAFADPRVGPEDDSRESPLPLHRIASPAGATDRADVAVWPPGSLPADARSPLRLSESEADVLVDRIRVEFDVPLHERDVESVSRIVDSAGEARLIRLTGGPTFVELDGKLLALSPPVSMTQRRVEWVGDLDGDGYVEYLLSLTASFRSSNGGHDSFGISLNTGPDLGWLATGVCLTPK